MIRAIFFDLDGTLRHTVPLGAEMYREKIIEFGIPVSDETHLEVCRWEHYYWAQSPELRQDSAKFDGDNDGFWRNYMETRLGVMGLGAEKGQIIPRLRDFFVNEYQPVNWVPPELYEILPALKSDGYILAVLSNRRSSFMDIMDDLSLSEFFDEIMFAGEVGSWKPAPDVFTHLLERMALKADETLYIGDNYYADVVGARRAGLQPLLYDPRQIFPEPDCPRVSSFLELTDFLEGIS